MLLGSTANHGSPQDHEQIIIQLMLQDRYSEAYHLLSSEREMPTSSLYNLARCLHWSGNYQGALSKLESIRLSSQLTDGNDLNTDSDHSAMKQKQRQFHDHLHGISEAYVKLFPSLVHDAVIRLKTDCWLALENYPKVIAVATPIAHKGYKNITDALNLAKTANDK